MAKIWIFDEIFWPPKIIKSYSTNVWIFDLHRCLKNSLTIYFWSPKHPTQRSGSRPELKYFFRTPSAKASWSVWVRTINIIQICTNTFGFFRLLILELRSFPVLPFFPFWDLWQKKEDCQLKMLQNPDPDWLLLLIHGRSPSCLGRNYG